MSRLCSFCSVLLCCCFHLRPCFCFRTATVSLPLQPPHSLSSICFASLPGTAPFYTGGSRIDRDALFLDLPLLLQSPLSLQNKSLSRQHHKAQAFIHLRLLKLLDSTALERTRQTLASSSSSSSSLHIFSPSANHSGGSKGTFTKSMSNIYDQQRRAKRDRQLQSSEGEERRQTSMYCSSEYRCLVGPAKERYCK